MFAYIYIMNNTTIILKVKERLNKLDSQDFTNIPTWQILEAFNKSQVEWVRRNTKGQNSQQQGDESSTSEIEDLQILIPNPLPLTFVDKGIYYQSDVSEWPSDFLRYKRLSLMATKYCCDKPKRFTCYLAEEANVDIYLNDVNRKPDYAWSQTFFTLTGNKLNLYHEHRFDISKCSLIYYRQPNRIQILGVVDAYTGSASLVEVSCEFGDDLIELLIIEATGVLAGDIEAIIQMQRSTQEEQKNN